MGSVITMEPMGHRMQAPVTLRADTSPERVAIVTMRDCYRIGHYCVTLDSIISFFISCGPRTHFYCYLCSIHLY